jgi:hypothetical protein
MVVPTATLVAETCDTRAIACAMLEMSIAVAWQAFRFWCFATNLRRGLGAEPPEVGLSGLPRLDGELEI